MVIHEPFRGYFAVVTDKTYGDEFEIQYFQKKREVVDSERKWFWFSPSKWAEACKKEGLMKNLIIFSNHNFPQNISWKSI